MTTLNLVERTKNVWKVTLKSMDGKTVVYPVEAYWAKDKVSTETIMLAAAAEANVQSTSTYVPISVAV